MKQLMSEGNVERLVQSFVRASGEINKKFSRKGKHRSNFCVVGEEDLPVIMLLRDVEYYQKGREIGR